MVERLARALVIARMTHLEARRDRVTLVVALFAVVIVVTSILFQEVTTTELDRIVRDVALAAVHLFGLVIAIYMGVSVVSREIERKTVYVLVTKPLGRAEYVAGKILGVALTLFVLVGAMTLAFVAQQLVSGMPLGWSIAQTTWLIYVQLVVVASFAVMVSTFTSSISAGFMAIGYFLVGQSVPDLWTIAAQSKEPAWAAFLKVLYFVLPNLQRFNLKSLASDLKVVPMAELALTTGYGLACIATYFAVAALVFERRDLK